jgi:septum site-determining protein MinC
MNLKADTVQIKGLRDGLLISLGTGEWQVLETVLLAQIDERSVFFTGARLALDVGNQLLHVAEMSKLRDSLSERNVSLWAVLSESPKTVQTAQLLGLATRIAKQRKVEKTPPSTDVGVGDGVLWVERTIRSGTRIEHPGNVVVIGDVNPGAEIVAEGNILVWGRLRGSVHAGDGSQAGASQNPEAFICALDMNPTRLQIASEIANSPKEKSPDKPQKASLKNGKFIVEAWQEK